MAATVFTNNGYGVHSMIGIEKSARLYRYSWATTSTDANSPMRSYSFSLGLPSGLVPVNAVATGIQVGIGPHLPQNLGVSNRGAVVAWISLQSYGGRAESDRSDA